MRVSGLGTCDPAFVMATAAQSFAGGEPAPPSDWRCKIAFRDAAGDKIQSDGATYVDGVAGVSCYIVVAPGATHSGWLLMSIANTRKSPSARYVRFVGQSFEGASVRDVQEQRRGHVRSQGSCQARSELSEPAPQRQAVPGAPQRRAVRGWIGLHGRRQQLHRRRPFLFDLLGVRPGDRCVLLGNHL